MTSPINQVAPPRRRPGPLRISCGLLGLLAASCTDGKRDPLGAEVMAPPLRAVIRAHEADVPLECRETGLKRVTCFFKSERRGCLYLEVGPEADGPGPLPPMVAPNQPVPDLCTRFTPDSRRVLLTSYTGHHEPIELSTDPAGERLAWRTRTDGWNVVYLLDGELLGNPTRRGGLSNLLSNTFGNLGVGPQDIGGLGLAPSGGHTGYEDSASVPVGDAGVGNRPIDWATTPTLEQAAPTLLDEVSGDKSAQLIAALKRRGGDDALLALLDHATPSRGWWDTVYDQLGEEAQKKAGDRLRAQLDVTPEAAETPDEALLEWFSRHPEQEPANYAEYLVAQVEASMSTDYDVSEGASVFLEQLVKRSHPRAGELACRVLGLRVSEGLLQSSEGVLSTLNLTALHALATQKTPCPWVGIELTHSACALDLRCSPSGVPEVSDDYTEFDPGTLNGKQNGLCPMAAVQRRVGTWNPEDTSNQLPGMLLLAAGYSVGPLPEEVLVKNARRQYRVVGRPPPRPDDDTEDVESSPCDVMPNTAENIACALPTSVSEVVIGGCRIRVEDEQRVLRLEDVRTRKTPVSRPYYGGESGVLRR